MFCKKGVLENFAKIIGKNTCARVSFFNINKVAGLWPQTPGFFSSLAEERTCGEKEILKSWKIKKTRIKMILLTKKCNFKAVLLIYG